MGKIRNLVLASALISQSIVPSKYNPSKPKYNVPQECFASNVSAESPGLALRLCREAIFNEHDAHKYAVLVSGSEEDRFKLDISLIYQVLLEKGFPGKNIYILDEDGREDFLYPVDGKSTKRNVAAIFNSLEKKVDDKDTLVFHISGHGFRLEKADKTYEGPTFAVWPEGSAAEDEVVSYLDGIKPGLGLVTTDICFGGGITKKAAKGNFVGISAAPKETENYMGPGDSFGGFFYQALSFRHKANADTDNDGRVTLSEAFSYAKTKHSASRNLKVFPQIDSEHHFPWETTID